MAPDELRKLLANGEDSTLEFKRDDVSNHELAKELVAFLNLDGGTVLLGVEDAGDIRGVIRDHLPEWVCELCRVKIEPPIVPSLSWAKDVKPGKHVLAVRVAQGPDKPYARIHNGRKTYCIRVGETSREASREELERLFQASGRLHYGLKPVSGASFDAFDLRRLQDYFTRVAGGEAPATQDAHGWEKLLRNLDLMTVSQKQLLSRWMASFYSAKLRDDFCPNAAFERFAIQASSRTTPPAPTKICEIPWFPWVMQRAAFWQTVWWSRHGISCAATQRQAPIWNMAGESKAGNIPRPHSAKP